MGFQGADFWHTAAVPRLGIPALRTSDGPNGVRGTRFFNGVPAACFPCATGLGATWDAELLHKVGNLLGEECKAKGAHILLGPTINIQRSPLGGRGFESYSEDGVLSGILAGHYCAGVIEENIIPTPKHFVCNDQEHERMGVDSIVTQRALREIYLKPFQIALKMSQPGAIMTAYNKINGTHASENKWIIEDILRKEWKWNGLLISDWYGICLHVLVPVRKANRWYLGLEYTALPTLSMLVLILKCQDLRVGVEALSNMLLRVTKLRLTSLMNEFATCST